MKGQGAGREMAAPKLTRKKLKTLLSAEFPEMFNTQSGYALEQVWRGGCRLRRHFHPKSLRPGGTVSGPIIMALADVAMYVAVLSAIGWVPLAVTTNLTINFLRKPAPRDLLAEARLIKLGKRLAVGEVGIRSDGGDDLVAHVTSTYSIPVADKR
ncbi:MAG: PaaI family thioesterase [Xanthobacteraceae bacterium]